MTFDLDYYFNYYFPEERPITVRVYKNIYYPPPPKDIKKYSSDKPPNKKSDIAELLIYVFVKLAERKNNQIITLYLKYLETINDPDKNPPTDGIFTINIAVITADDYVSFFKKIKRKPWTKE